MGKIYPHYSGGSMSIEMFIIGFICGVVACGVLILIFMVGFI